MAADIAPELLEKLQKAFGKKLEKIELQAKNYPGAFDYAEAVGTALAEVFAENLSGEELPDGKLYWNIANSVIKPMLERDHTLVSDAVVEVQTALNQAAGLGIKAQRPSLNSDKVSGILNRLASEESFDDVAWILREPVITFSMGVVDDGVRANAEFQSKAGLGVKIIRTMKGKGCAWCRALAGTYDYDEEPRDIYRRHDNCRCTVEIVSSRGRDVVHSGTEGKRRYVPDKYGGYEMTDEAKAARRREREATAAERAKVAREKRIATWAKKKQNGWTSDAAPDKIETRKSVGLSDAALSGRSNATVIQAVRSGEVSLTVNPEKQNRHLKDSKVYTQGRSYMNGTLEDVQALVDKLAGTGESITTSKGWTHKERVTANHMIGKYVNADTGEETSTKNAIIIYSKTGTHIVPAKE